MLVVLAQTTGPVMEPVTLAFDWWLGIPVLVWQTALTVFGMLGAAFLTAWIAQNRERLLRRESRRMVLPGRFEAACCMLRKTLQEHERCAIMDSYWGLMASKWGKTPNVSESQTTHAALAQRHAFGNRQYDSGNAARRAEADLLAVVHELRTEYAEIRVLPRALDKLQTQVETYDANDFNLRKRLKNVVNEVDGATVVHDVQQDADRFVTNHFGDAPQRVLDLLASAKKH